MLAGRSDDASIDQPELQAIDPSDEQEVFVPPPLARQSSLAEAKVVQPGAAVARAKKSGAMTPRKKKMMLYIHNMLTGMPMMLIMNSRMGIYIRDANGDTAVYGRIIAYLQTYLQASSLVVTPVWAGLASSVGRRPLILWSTMGAVFLRSVEIAMGLTSNSLVLCNYLMPIFNGGVLARQAMIGDLYGDDVIEQAAFNSSLMVIMVINSMLGPLIGAWLARQHVNAPFYAALTLAVANATVVWVDPAFKETLPDFERRPFKVQRSNPLSFTSLFTKSTELCKLSVLQMLADITGPNSTYGILALFRQDMLGWDISKRSLFMSLSSAIALPGYVFAGKLLRRLGQLHAYAGGTVANAVSLLLTSSSMAATDAGQVIVLPLGWPRQMGTAALSSMFTAEALRCGLDHSDVAAAQSNLASVIGMITPMALNRLYEWGSARGDPGWLLRVLAGIVGVQILFSFTLEGDYSKKETAKETETEKEKEEEEEGERTAQEAKDEDGSDGDGDDSCDDGGDVVLMAMATLRPKTNRLRRAAISHSGAAAGKMRSDIASIKSSRLLV